MSKEWLVKLSKDAEPLKLQVFDESGEMLAMHLRMQLMKSRNAQVQDLDWKTFQFSFEPDGPPIDFEDETTATRLSTENTLYFLRNKASVSRKRKRADEGKVQDFITSFGGRRPLILAK